MAYQIIHLENLTELKSRVGGTTTPTLATVLGLNYPTVEAFSVYVWDNNSNSIPDDESIVRPNPRATLPGRWYKVELDVAPHSHPINQINGLQSELDSKLEDEDDPTVGDHIKDITITDISNWNNKDYNSLTNIPSTFAPSAHFHSVSEILNLQILLDNKATSLHTHTISDVTGLQTALNNKISVGASIPYNTLTNTPTIPAAQVNADWNSSSGVSMILNKPTIPTPISLTTTGVGTATLSGSVLNIPNPSNMFVINNAIVGLSKATLNTTYPNTPVGYMVLCPSITLGGAVYIRATTGASGIWQTISAPPTL